MASKKAEIQYDKKNVIKNKKNVTKNKKNVTTKEFDYYEKLNEHVDFFKKNVNSLISGDKNDFEKLKLKPVNDSIIEFGVINFHNNNYTVQSGGNQDAIKTCVGNKSLNENISFTLYTDKKFEFFINDKNTNIAKDLIDRDAFFLNFGAYNLVYDITLKSENSKISENNEYILKLMSDKDKYEKIVYKYHLDKKICAKVCKNINDSVYKSHNINPLLDIYAQGVVTFDSEKCNDTPIFFFITKKYKCIDEYYNNIISVNQLSHDNKIFAFNEFVKLTKEFYKMLYVINDIKAVNLGYEMININNEEKPLFIIIDYDPVLILEIYNFFVSDAKMSYVINKKTKKPYIRNIECFDLGTFCPYHIFMKINKNESHLKMLENSVAFSHKINYYVTPNDILFNSLAGLFDIFVYLFLIIGEKCDFYNILCDNLCNIHCDTISYLAKNNDDLFSKMLNVLSCNIDRFKYIIGNIFNIEYIDLYFVKNTIKLDSSYFDKLMIKSFEHNEIMIYKNPKIKNMMYMMEDINKSTDYQKYFINLTINKNSPDHFFDFEVQIIDPEYVKKIIDNYSELEQLPSVFSDFVLYTNDDVSTVNIEFFSDRSYFAIVNDIQQLFTEDNLTRHIFDKYCNRYIAHNQEKHKKKYLLIK